MEQFGFLPNECAKVIMAGCKAMVNNNGDKINKDISQYWHGMFEDMVEFVNNLK